jgi:hypothetical protein
MDKIVRRVTVVEREGAHKKAKVVYNAVDDDEDDEDEPSLHPLERRVRRLLKANLVQAQEAYQQHLNSVAKGGSAWVYDSPRNLMRARRKAMKDLHKSGPFKTPDSDDDEED